jgi:hypothetical protein
MNATTPEILSLRQVKEIVNTLPLTMGHGAVSRIAVLDIIDDAIRHAVSPHPFIVAIVAAAKDARSAALSEARHEVEALRVDEIVGAPIGYEHGWNEATRIFLAILDRLSRAAS